MKVFDDLASEYLGSWGKLIKNVRHRLCCQKLGIGSESPGTTMFNIVLSNNETQWWVRDSEPKRKVILSHIGLSNFEIKLLILWSDLWLNKHGLNACIIKIIISVAVNSRAHTVRATIAERSHYARDSIVLCVWAGCMCWHRARSANHTLSQVRCLLRTHKRPRFVHADAARKIVQQLWHGLSVVNIFFCDGKIRHAAVRAIRRCHSSGIILITGHFAQKKVLNQYLKIGKHFIRIFLPISGFC